MHTSFLKRIIQRDKEMTNRTTNILQALGISIKQAEKNSQKSQMHVKSFQISVVPD